MTSNPSQATQLPEIKQLPIPNIPKLEKDGYFSSWSAQVHSVLKSLGIDSLVSTLPRPSPTEDLNYVRWRVWSLNVRSWLFGQMTNDMLDYVLVFYRQQGEKGPLPRYADEMFALIKLAANASSGLLPQAVKSFWSNRRSQFPSPEEYIHRWITAVEHLRSLDHPLTTYTAAEIMCLELEEELPLPIAKIRAKMKGTESELEASAFSEICHDLLNDITGTKNALLAETFGL